MPVTRDTSADGAEALRSSMSGMSGPPEPSRVLSGPQVVVLRAAIEAAEAALARVNLKGLPFAQRQQFTLAIACLRTAAPCLSGPQTLLPEPAAIGGR